MLRGSNNGVMTASYDDAVAVQRRHEDELLALPGVTGVGAKLREGRAVLVVDVDPEAEVPQQLRRDEIDGIALVVERATYRLLGDEPPAADR